MHSRKVDQGAARAMNRWLVLNELRREGPLSRTRIARLTGLSPAAITGVTGDLLTEKLLVEHPELSLHLPRRPVPLGVNYGGHLAVGIKLLAHELQAVLTDLALNVVAKTVVPLTSADPSAVVAAAQQARRQLLAGQPGQPHVVGVGLGLAGVIDVERGVCVDSYRFGWRNVPLAGLLRAELLVPVWIDNDINAFATAERLVGRARQETDFIVVTLGRGVGAALVLDGRLYRGPGGAAGEFGHVLSQPGGRLCECGMHGCLEAYVSSPNLVAQFNEQYPDQPVTSIEALSALLQGGDDRPKLLLEAAGERLGFALADLTNVLGSELIIIGGEGVAIGDPLLGAARQALNLRRMLKRAPMRLLIDPWGDDAWARGAAGLVVEQFFEGPAGRLDSRRALHIAT